MNMYTAPNFLSHKKYAELIQLGGPSNYGQGGGGELTQHGSLVRV